jgi:hypothetical protein
MKDQNSNQRRNFIMKTSAWIGTGIFLQPFSLFSRSPKIVYTVGEIMDRFIAAVPDSPFEKTVDTLKSGNKDHVCDHHGNSKSN